MYNRGRYNRTPYNRNSLPPNQFRSRHFELEAQMESAFGRRITLKTEIAGMQLDMPGTTPNRIKLFLPNEIKAELQFASQNYILIKYFNPSLIALDLGMTVALPDAIYTLQSQDMSARLEQAASPLGLYMIARGDYALQATAIGAPSLQISAITQPVLLQIEFSGESNAFATIEALVDLVLKPGQILIIDSDPDKFSVTIDGMNVQHIYNGPFFIVDPDTMSFDFSFGEGTAADMQIEYTEKWY